MIVTKNLLRVWWRWCKSEWWLKWSQNVLNLKGWIISWWCVWCSNMKTHLLWITSLHKHIHPQEFLVRVIMPEWGSFLTFSTIPTIIRKHWRFYIFYLIYIPYFILTSNSIDVSINFFLIKKTNILTYIFYYFQYIFLNISDLNPTR